MDCLLTPDFDNGDCLAVILTFLSPKELTTLSGACRTLRAYATHDIFWRYFALRDFGVSCLNKHDERWYAAYVRAQCKSIGWPRMDIEGVLAAHRKANELASSAGGIASEWLHSVDKRCGLSVKGLEPYHMTPAMLSAVRDADARIDPTWAATPAAVAVLHAATLPPAQFWAEFESSGRTVVIQGAVGHWPAAAWTLDVIASAAGNATTFSVAHRAGAPYGNDLKLRISLPAYLSYCRSPLALRDDLPLYIFDADFGEIAPQLLSGYDVASLRYFAEDLLAGLGRALRPGYRWLVVGGPRSGTPWHWDPHGTSAWNALLHGNKRWFVYPPGWEVPGVAIDRDAGRRPTTFRAPLSPAQWLSEVYPHLPLAAKPTEFLQRAGDLVFIPSGAWHMVLNLEETVSVTQNYVGSGIGSCGGVSFARMGHHMQLDSNSSNSGSDAYDGGAADNYDASIDPIPPISAPGPAPVVTGNLLEVLQELAVLADCTSSSSGSSSHMSAEGCDSDDDDDDDDSTPSSPFAAGDAAKMGQTAVSGVSNTGGGARPAISEGGDDRIRASHSRQGPDPDPHGLTFAPPLVPAEQLKGLPPDEALLVASLAEAEAATMTAAAAGGGDAVDPSSAYARYALLTEAFTLAQWHRRELQLLLQQSLSALASLDGNGSALAEELRKDYQSGTSAAPSFSSHAHLVSSFKSPALYSGLLNGVIAASIACSAAQQALPRLWLQSNSDSHFALSAQPLTSRTNPTFLLLPPPSSTSIAEKDHTSAAAVVKLFSQFVCEDGGRPFQPAAALASWRIEAAVLRHWAERYASSSLSSDVVTLPRLLASGFARSPSQLVYDAFSPNRLSVLSFDGDGASSAAAAGPTSLSDVSYEVRTVPLSDGDGWCWPYAVTQFIGRAPSAASADSGSGTSADSGEVISLATAREQLTKSLSSGGASSDASAAASTWHRSIAGCLGPLLAHFHSEALRSPKLVQRLLSFHISSVGDNSGTGAVDVMRPVRLPYPSYGSSAYPQLRGVILPLAWAPYFARLLSLRQTAVGRRERARHAPLHLLPQADAFLPPLHQTHVLLPLRVHPAYLPVDAAGFVDLMPALPHLPALLHGDLTADNILGCCHPVPSDEIDGFTGSSGETRPAGAADAFASAAASHLLRWRPTAFIDLADCLLGDPLWDAVALTCSALGGDTAALGDWVRAYDKATADGMSGTSPLPFRGDPSLGYRLVCLLLLHPVDGTHLLLQPPPRPAAAAAAESKAECGPQSAVAGIEDDGTLPPITAADLRGLPLSWGELAATIMAAIN